MKRSRKIALVAIPIIVGGCTVILLSNWGNGPAEGTIYTGQPSRGTESTQADSPLPIDTLLLTVTLPAGFVSKDASPPTAEVPVRTLATNTSTRQQVGLSGGKLPAEGLNGIGDYNVRVKNTTDYKRSTLTSLPTGAVAFEDTTGSMVTLFWPHGGQYASMTVSGSTGSVRELNQLLLKVLQTWQWK